MTDVKDMTAEELLIRSHGDDCSRDCPGYVPGCTVGKPPCPIDAELLARLRGYDSLKRMFEKMRSDPTAAELAHIIAETALENIRSARAGR